MTWWSSLTAASTSPTLDQSLAARAVGPDLCWSVPRHARSGTLTLLIDDFILPNGLAFSPDESVLYINDSRRSYIRAFDLLPNGTLAKQTDRVFVDLRGEEPGVPDGMKVDVEGNVYCGGAGGLWIMDPHGKKLGRIVHGAAAYQPGLWRR